MEEYTAVTMNDRLEITAIRGVPVVVPADLNDFCRAQGWELLAEERENGQWVCLLSRPTQRPVTGADTRPVANAFYANYPEYKTTMPEGADRNDG